MKRTVALPFLLLPLLAPPAARAQDRFSAEVSAGAEHTSNSRLVPEDQTEEADNVFKVNPSVTGRLERRGFTGTLRYNLQYWHFQEQDDLDRVLHDLEARAAMTWWDDVDLEFYEALVPIKRSFVDPLENPVSSVQSSHAGAKVALRHEFGPATRVLAGYTGERVDFVKVHRNDALPPEYFLHDPGVGFERDLGPRVTLGLGYRFRLQLFDRKYGDGGPLGGDVTGHVVTLTPRIEATDWLLLDGAVGVQAVSFANAAIDPVTRVLVDARVRAGGEIAAAVASYGQRLTEDTAGNEAEVRLAQLRGEITPFAPWTLSAGATYGSQDLVVDTSGADPSRTFVEASAGMSYKVSVGVLALGGSYHQTLEETGSAAINVTRVSLSLGGRF